MRDAPADLISVADELPPEFERIEIVLASNQHQHSIGWWGGYHWMRWNSKSGQTETLEADAVTYWRPLTDKQAKMLEETS